MAKTTYTVNTAGDNRYMAEKWDYHAYYANGVTASEIPADTKEEAREIAEIITGQEVYYVFE